MDQKQYEEAILGNDAAKSAPLLAAEMLAKAIAKSPKPNPKEK